MATGTRRKLRNTGTKRTHKVTAGDCITVQGDSDHEENLEVYEGCDHDKERQHDDDDSDADSNHHPPGRSTQIGRILDRIHRVWDITDINKHLEPAVCPSIWTERPAKQLSKLAHATGTEHRTWAMAQLNREARGCPLTKSIIEQVYQQALKEGKSVSRHSARGSQTAAMIPDTPTPQAHRQQSATTSHSQIASEVAVSPELGNSHTATPSVSPSPSPSPSYQPIQPPSDQGYGEQGIEGELENIMNGIDGETLVICSLQRFMPLASLSANK